MATSFLTKQRVIDLLTDKNPRTFVELKHDLGCGAELLRPMLKEMVRDKQIAQLKHRNGFKYCHTGVTQLIQPKLEERILAALSGVRNFTVAGLASRFGITDVKARAHLESLVEQGLAKRIKTSRYLSYHAVEEVKEEITNPRYIAEFKPLGIYDMKSFMRLAEGSRNQERGMV